MARTISVNIVGNSADLERAFAKAGRSAEGFKSRLGRTAKGIGKVAAFGGATAGITALFAGLKVGFDEFSEGEKVAAQTGAVLKSTGAIANVTAKQVDGLATALMNKSGVDDEVIKSGENVLLTFTNIRNEAGKGNDIFSQATASALDLSVALGQDMKSSTIQLGKALNDPIKGVTALQRVGVSFTAEQKKQIKTLVETGRTMDAQKLILAELRKEFGGSAAAAGGTLSGKINILKESLTNLSGEIVGKLAPSMIKLIDRATKWIQNAQNQKKITDAVTGAVKLLRDIFNAIAPIVVTTAKVIKRLTEEVGGAKNAIKLLLGVFVLWKAAKMASAVAGVATQFGIMGTKAKGAQGSVNLLKGSLLGKAGLVGAVGLLSFKLTGAILKMTGLDKKLSTLGGKARDLTDKLGITSDPGKQFAGKTVLSASASKFLKNQAARLEAGGLSPAAAAARLSATHPNVALHDLESLAGVRGNLPVLAGGGVVNHIKVEIDGQEVEPKFTVRQAKRAKRTPIQTRGRQT